MGFSDQLTAALTGAPDLLHSPGLAYGVASGATAAGLNPYDTAQAASHASNMSAIAGAAQSAPHGVLQDIGNWASGMLHDVAHPTNGIMRGIHDVIGGVSPAAGAALNTMNAPLQDVQHQYRYLRAVQDRHGTMAMLGEAIPMLGVGAGVFALTDSAQAGLMAGEGTGFVEGQLFYHDLWNKTAKSYTDIAGNNVSPGFDLANLVHHVLGEQGQYHPNTGLDVGSGLGNAVFDLSLDPTILGGKVMHGADLHGLSIGGKDLVVGRAVSLVPDGTRADTLLNIFNNRADVRRAMTSIANESSAGKIADMWPMLRPLAPQLADAQTPLDVLDVFRNALTRENYANAPFTELPRTGLTRLNLGRAAVSQWVKNVGSRPLLDANGNQIISGVTGKAIEGYGPNAEAATNPLEAGAQILGTALHKLTTYRPFALDPETLKLSAKEFDPASNDRTTLNGVYRALRLSQNDRTASAIFSDYVKGDVATRVNIYKNAMRDALRGLGFADDHPMLAPLTGDMSTMADVVKDRTYGSNDLGRKVVGPDGQNTALLMSQTGKLSFPDFAKIQSEVRQISSSPVIRKLGAADDWINSHYTTRWFKPLALTSLGFALRVAGGELVPAGLAMGGKSVASGLLASASAKLGFAPDLAELAREAPDALVGKLARYKSYTGQIASISPDAATLRLRDGTEKAVATKELTPLHDPFQDSAIRKAAKQLGHAVPSKMEMPHIKAAIGKALYGLSRALVDEDFRNMAAWNALSFDGGMVHPMLTSEDHSSDAFIAPGKKFAADLAKMGKTVPKKMRLADSWTTWDSGNDYHPMFWHGYHDRMFRDNGLRAQATAYMDVIHSGGTREAAAEAAKAADTAFLSSPEGSAWRKMLAQGREGADPAVFAAQRHEAMRGVFIGRARLPDGGLGDPVYHDTLLEHGAHGVTPPVEWFDQVPIGQRPVAVPGRELDPSPVVGHPGPIDFFWRKFIHPTINSLSREPLYTAFSANEYKRLKPWVEAGNLSHAEAIGMAQQRAATRMLGFVHNTLLRSQAHDVMRNFYPFWFAQEQAYKRYGRAILENPVAFRELQLAVHGIHQSGAILANGGGSQYLVFPGLGNLSPSLMSGLQALGVPVQGGLPTMVSGDVASLRTVIPESQLPAGSPLLAVPLKVIQGLFPQSDPIVNKIPGYNSYAQNSSMLSEFLPNAAFNRIVQGLQASDQNRGFATSFNYAMQWAAHQADILRGQAAAADPAAHNFVGTDYSTLNPKAQALMKEADAFWPSPAADPQTKQRAIDRLRNTTRINFLVKAAIGMFTPLSPAMDVGDFKLRAEVSNQIKQHGLALGIQNFLKAHPDAAPDTVFLSDSRYTGASMPATQAAMNWVNANSSWVSNHTYGAAYLMPQTADPFSYQAYNQQLAAGLRARKTTAQMADALDAASTNAEFYNSLSDYHKMIANANPEQKRQINTQWQAYVQQLATANPVWYADLQDPRKKEVAQLAYEQLAQAVADPSGTPQTPMLHYAQDLVSSYKDLSNELALVKAKQVAGVSQTALKNMWTTFLDQYAAANPQAQSMITGVFRRLPA